MIGSRNSQLYGVESREQKVDDYFIRLINLARRIIIVENRGECSRKVEGGEEQALPDTVVHLHILRLTWVYPWVSQRLVMRR